MGNHAPSRSSLRDLLKEKRSIVVVTATGAALIAAGTAGAATVDRLAAAPESATGKAALPEAATADGRPAPRNSPGQDHAEAQEQRQQALEAATQSFTGTATQEQKPEPEQDSGGSGGSDEAADMSPTGEGGACEASMYSEPQPTASGEQFDPSAMTAAHKSLPMDTMVRVTNPGTGASVTVRINDRGPYVAGRCLDLSTASFEQIASADAGVVDVEWQALS
ncbi:septal ring lytic transglycosylase RlpA family protein [Streptomonospora wellingtoniae]|uniref:Probable endolytic peptidoglycan transglycosylase RlpA n=1 Tax=Streptomonospora wellingtoniae TaxID=3075544 RepID=A0ABU2KWS3_9ACTN|nr:septal ring lytic transglycosylase RlpA family protein [Streptomonospora sp. DSM 45055]MDT0303755.1 septal ring lytic transglycosylase RlpA family protein [Streptomonospora sp. DSM 45055]